MKAVKLIEKHFRVTQALLAEFRRLLDDLAERLTPRPDGRRKVLRAGAVNSLREFFERFGELNGGAPAALERAVAEAREVLSDWQPHELRNLSVARQEVAEGLAQVAARLAALAEQGRLRYSGRVSRGV
ncbi:MAG TPA: hypothetical protein VKA46_33005 [Gemmataceae bacterium]|nr:hypothetical protein [Gemmataceae bacterium]